MQKLMLLMMAMTLTAGCGAIKLRVGPVGSGIASTASGPGIEMAVSDKTGEPMAAFSAKINLPGILAEGWSWVHEHLPQLGAYFGSNAPVPTGPTGV